MSVPSSWIEDQYTGEPKELSDVLVTSRVVWAEYEDGSPYPNEEEQMIWRHGGDYPDDPELWRERVIWDYVMSRVSGGVWAEYGVAAGNSARFWLRHLPDDGKLYLLDSFDGLPEEWNGNPVGTFACEVPEFNDERVEIIKGWFEETAKIPETLDFVHIDSDLYSSAKTILNSIKVRKGTIILFDEFWGEPGWENGEYKALMEWDVPYRFIVRDTHIRAAIEVLESN